MPNLVFYSTFVRIYLEYLDKKKHSNLFCQLIVVHYAFMCEYKAATVLVFFFMWVTFCPTVLWTFFN
jgi:hypothetical protein